MTTADHSNIASLVQRAKQQDREAFEQLVRKMMPALVATTYRMTNDHEVARDLAQETLITAWEKLDQLKQPERFAGWVTKIAASKSLNHLRRKDPLGETVGEVELAATVDEADGLDQMRMRKAFLMQAIGSLAPMQRMVFELRFYQQMTFPEIAEATDKALGTVKTHYRLAVAHLRKMAKKEQVD